MFWRRKKAQPANAKATEPVVPTQLRPLLDEAYAAEQRFESTGDLNALDQTADAWIRIVSHPLITSMDRRLRLQIWGEAAALRMRRYTVRGLKKDLDDALEIWNRAIAEAPPDEPNLALLLTNLSGGLVTRHRSFGSPGDLDRAIELLERATVLVTGPDRAIAISGLASALDSRHTLTGTVEDLDRAVDLARTAVEIARNGSPNLPAYLNNLGVLLRSRFSVGNHQQDIDSAVEVLAEAVSSTPQGSPQLLHRKHSLGQALSTHYDATGSLDDLERAVAILIQTSNATADDAPQLPARMHDLGLALLALHKRTHREQVLRDAIKALEDAVHRTPSESPDVATRQANLAVALMVLSEETEDAEALDTAVAILEGLVTILKEGSIASPARLTSLGNALQLRYRRREQRPDLDRSIELYERTLVAAKPSEHNFPSYLSNLATALRLRYDDGHNPLDLERATQAYRRGCGVAAQVNRTTHLVVARNWGIWSSERQSWTEAAEAFDQALRAAETLYSGHVLRAHKETWLHEFSDLPAIAAYAFARTGAFERAVTTLERGRAQLLSEVLERARVDLRTLRDLGHDDLANRYIKASTRLDKLEKRELETAATDSERNARAAAIGDAHDEIQGLTRSIRRLAGMEQFAVLPGFEMVAEAAASIPLVYIAATDRGGFALIVRSGGSITPVWLDHLTDAEVRSHLSAYGKAYEQREGALIASQDALDALTRWCWNAAMGPLLDALSGERQTMLIAIGYLGLVPLHAAWTPAVDTVTQRRYALDDLQLSFAPNARTIVESRKVATRVTAGSVLVVADSGGSAGALPHAQDEARSVAAAFADSKSYSEGATRKTVLEQISRYPVVHFSCHAIGNVANPLASALLLSDGSITIRELLETPLPANLLVVMSACETALIGSALPDEVVGLPAGFLQAGAAAVVGSMWAVPEVSTLLVMARFYELWQREGLAAPEALRQAQRWVRDATNFEKYARFSEVAALSASRIPKAAQELWGSARVHMGSYHWAAFTFIGA